MQRALDTHDTVLRALLARYYGYEVTTEGDSFTMAFHDPVDAVSFLYFVFFTSLLLSRLQDTRNCVLSLSSSPFFARIVCKTQYTLGVLKTLEEAVRTACHRFSFPGLRVCVIHDFQELQW